MQSFTLKFSTHRIIGVPAFTDNYLWLLVQGAAAWAIDPGDASTIEHLLHAQQINLHGIVLTHHHHDHVGGVAALCESRDIPVFGPADPDMPMVTQTLIDGATCPLDGLGITLEVLAVPGHTREHLAYFIAAAEDRPPLLFCGDTLFAGGCGRLFTGTAAQLHASLQRLTQLPPQTLICCAHEYTLSNLRFAQQVDPTNTALSERVAWAQQQRAAHRPTVPSTLADELRTNPFLRVTEPAIQQAVQQHTGLSHPTPGETFTALRKWKDVFRGY